MSHPDNSPRPHKRQRLIDEKGNVLSSPSTLSTLSSSCTNSPRNPPRNIPAPVLLSSIPGLVAHPPNHRHYVLSLQVSLNALRKCLSFPALSPEIECRAWTGLAELGMRVIASGFCEGDAHPWAKGIEMEVDKALSKGAIIAQKHPSLRSFKHHLALLQAQYSHWQHKPKYARTQIRNLISSFSSTDPPYLIYSAYLTSITLFTSPHPPSSHPSSSAQSDVSLHDVHTALSIVQTMESRALNSGHAQIALLAYVLRLRILISANIWSEVRAAVERVERALGLSYAPASPTGRKAPGKEGSKEEAGFIMFEDPFEAAMAVHALMMTVAYYTHTGSASEASPRLSHLHAVLDSGVLDLFPDGLVQIALPTGPPLVVQVTHPRVLFQLTFLVSSTAKRDAVGRKPKRKVFAMEGLASHDNEKVLPPLTLPVWADLGDVEEVEERLARIKADLMCEVVAVSIMRSEFMEARKTLDELVAHTRTYCIFPLFAARICLHHAHLAHALGNTSRAVQCYQIASQLSEEGDFVDVAAKAGVVSLDLNRYLRQLDKGKGKQRAVDDEDEGEAVDVKALLSACRGRGGTLEAVGHILEACLSPEILKAKQHLKAALSLASGSQDNHLRALILALVASEYFYTAREHCLATLLTCEQLAAGLGAPMNKGGAFSGNVHLALWAGRHFLELYRQAGQEVEAAQREESNGRLEKALDRLREMGLELETASG